MKSVIRHRGLLLRAVLGLSGTTAAVACGTTGDLPGPIEDVAEAVGVVDPVGAPPAATRTVEENLRRLAALSIFEVGVLVDTSPQEARACPYNTPCDAEDEAIIAAAEAEQAARLEALVDVAEAASGEVYGGEAAACDGASIESNLALLDAMNIVEVGALVEAEPATSPSCYNLACPEDVAAAEATTCERAQQLERIVLDAEGL